MKPYPGVLRSGGVTRLRLFALLVAAIIAAFPSTGAWAQSEGRNPSVSNFPTPARVLRDVEARANGADDLTIAARQAGRFLMLTTVLKNIQPRGRQFDRDQWPRRDAQLYDTYADEYGKIRDRFEPTLENGCPDRGPCRRRDFYEMVGDYQYDIGPAEEVANLYFPASERAQFIELSGGSGTRTANEARMAEARAENAAVKARRDAKDAELQAALIYMLLLPLAVLFVLVVVIRGVIKGKEKRKAAHDSYRDGLLEETLANLLEQFDTDPSSRLESINKAFDEKKRTVSIKISWVHNERADRFIRCEVARSLASMSAKEREILRSVILLRHEGLNPFPYNTWVSALGLIYGDGKGTILGGSDFNLSDITTASIRTINEALEWLNRDRLDSALNLALADLTSAIGSHPENPVVRTLVARVLGNGGDLATAGVLHPVDDQTRTPQTLLIGRDERDQSQILGFSGEGSVITVAPSRSGKTQCHVIPNLLTWEGPAVVLDVKGDIFDLTSGWRAANVGPVIKFSPLSPDTSHRYNPLAEVSEDPDSIWEDSRFLADMLIVPTGSKEPFWENRARDIVTAAIAHIVAHYPFEERSMSKVLDILHGVGWDSLVIRLSASSVPTMARSGNSLGEMESKTRDSVLQTALASLSAWEGNRITRATAASDWRPLDLRNGQNPTIYICLTPKEIDSYASLLRVIIAQHIRQLTAVLPPRDAKPILFVLDELPRLKHMPPVEEALDTGLQYGVKLWMFAQTLGQLEKAYPNAEGMVGGCAVRMFMNPSLHDETAQKLSDDMGFVESVVDGTRVKRVEPNVLAGPDFKDRIIVMAASAEPCTVRKAYAHADPEMVTRMAIPPVEIAKRAAS